VKGEGLAGFSWFSKLSQDSTMDKASLKEEEGAVEDIRGPILPQISLFYSSSCPHHFNPILGQFCNTKIPLEASPSGSKGYVPLGLRICHFPSSIPFQFLFKWTQLKPQKFNQDAHT